MTSTVGDSKGAFVAEEDIDVRLRAADGKVSGSRVESDGC